MRRRIGWSAVGVLILVGCGEGESESRAIRLPDGALGRHRFIGDAAPLPKEGDGAATGPDRRDAGPPGPGDPDAGPAPPIDASPPGPDAAPPAPDAAPPPPPDAGPPPPNAGWIGGPCRDHGDCDYPEAFCLREDEGYPGGLCSLGCDRFCPDREGAPVTFCVDGVIVGQGACMQRCDYEAFEHGCRPGWHCETRPRYGERDTRRGVCVPGDPEPSPMLGCRAEMDARGLDYGVDSSPDAHPDGRPDLTCRVEGPVRLRSPIGGVRYRYISHDEPRPMFMSCHLANALDELSALLREFDIVEVGHIGTYNCRLISGTDSLSMHGLGLAIDLRWFRDRDGNVYDVLRHWEHDTDNPRTREGRVLYEIATQMFERRIFNIILTPNYNAAHDDHFHVDLTPGGRFIGSEGTFWHGHIGPNPHGD